MANERPPMPELPEQAMRALERVCAPQPTKPSNIDVLKEMRKSPEHRLACQLLSQIE